MIGDTAGAFALYGQSLSDAARAYPQLNGETDQAIAHARRVSLQASETADGNVVELELMLRDLRRFVEEAPEAREQRLGDLRVGKPFSRQTLSSLRQSTKAIAITSEAAFLAARLGHDGFARLWLARINDDVVGRGPNGANLVLSHARIDDYDGARRRLLHINVDPVVLTSLRARIERSEALRRKAGDRVSLALALAELGAYLRALRVLRPMTVTSDNPGLAQLYIQLLMSARLEREAAREARAAFGAERGGEMIETLRARLAPRVAALSPPDDENAWWQVP